MGLFITEFEPYGSYILSTALPNVCGVDPTQAKRIHSFINVISISLFVDNKTAGWTSLIKYKALSGIS
jgi:hypothetical protein